MSSSTNEGLGQGTVAGPVNHQSDLALHFPMRQGTMFAASGVVAQVHLPNAPDRPARSLYVRVVIDTQLEDGVVLTLVVDADEPHELELISGFSTHHGSGCRYMGEVTEGTPSQKIQSLPGSRFDGWKEYEAFSDEWHVRRGEPQPGE